MLYYYHIAFWIFVIMNNTIIDKIKNKDIFNSERDQDSEKRERERDREREKRKIESETK